MSAIFDYFVLYKNILTTATISGIYSVYENIALSNDNEEEMMTTIEELPAQVIFGEEGDWEMPSWGRHPDDEEWITYGWRVYLPEGRVLFTNQQEAVVRQWLADNGYVDVVGEDYRYVRKVEEVS
jgi:hypothetical protein